MAHSVYVTTRASAFCTRCSLDNYVCSACAIQNWVGIVEECVHKRTDNSSSHVTWQRRAYVHRYGSVQTSRHSVRGNETSRAALLVTPSILTASANGTSQPATFTSFSGSAAALDCCAVHRSTASDLSGLMTSCWTTCERQQSSFTGCWRRWSTTFSTKQRTAVCRLLSDCAVHWICTGTPTVCDYTRLRSDTNEQCTISYIGWNSFSVRASDIFIYFSIRLGNYICYWHSHFSKFAFVLAKSNIQWNIYGFCLMECSWYCNVSEVQKL